MEYRIIGEPFPVVECNLKQGETMKCQSGAMAWMSSNMQMATKSGGLGKMFSKALAGESMFSNEYTAQGGDGVIAFNTAVPGYILAADVTPDKSIIAQKNAFLASEAGVEMEVTTNNAKTGFTGGEGFIMQKFVGNGKVFMEIDGAVVEKELAAGEKLVLSTGMLAAMEDTVTMSSEKVGGGMANALLGGEGLFNTTVTGPGKVWLQTMPVSELANSIKPFIPTKS